MTAAEVLAACEGDVELARAVRTLFGRIEHDDGGKDQGESSARLPEAPAEQVETR